jgi:hypothetical protein
MARTEQELGIDESSRSFLDGTTGYGLESPTTQPSQAAKALDIRCRITQNAFREPHSVLNPFEA